MLGYYQKKVYYQKKWSMDTLLGKAGDQRDWGAIRGFNYQPSYTSSGLETWRNFDANIFRTELTRGKRYFPGINTVRLWLSWDAFIRGHNYFCESFEEALNICDALRIKVIPVIFNRWHDQGTDFGGIYIDHFLKGSSWVQSEGMFDSYIEKVVGGHAKDSRILCWDLCNEPFSYTDPIETINSVIVQSERDWLSQINDRCRAFDLIQPVGVSVHTNHGIVGLEYVEPLSDVLLIHPYSNDGGILDLFESFSKKVGKPLLATETCWGAIEDSERVKIIVGTLKELVARNIGFLPHLLHHSMVSDGHRPEFGSINRPGFHFIEVDGSLRPGHQIFNKY